MWSEAFPKLERERLSHQMAIDQFTLFTCSGQVDQ